MKRRPLTWHLALALLLAPTIAACGGSYHVPTVPTYEIWTSTGSLTTARASHTATLLTDGDVLVAGGEGPEPLASAELYDPHTGIWTPTGYMHSARDDTPATLLSNGMVLVAGGRTALTVLVAAELYDPATGMWTATGTMHEPREEPSATRLLDGRVLVAGGVCGSCGGMDVDTTELFSLTTIPPVHL